MRQRLVALEEPVGTRTPGVHDPLRNSLMVKVGNLFAEYEILQKGGTPDSCLEGILVV